MGFTKILKNAFNFLINILHIYFKLTLTIRNIKKPLKESR